MPTLGEWVIVFVTASSRYEAEMIAKKLVEDKLAACVNIVENIRSIYWWRNNIESSSETLLVIKTKISKLHGLIEIVRSLHSYQVPEIIALPIIAGYKDYLNWLDKSLNRES